MNLKTIFFILSIIFFLSEIYCQYPEDFSSIEQLTYLETDSDKEEVFIGSYFQDASLTNAKDFRNGIIINYKNLIDSSTTEECSTTLNPYPGNDDIPWDHDNYENIYFPFSYGLRNPSNQCYKIGNSILKLSEILTEEEIDFAKEYDLSYFFYFWIQKVDTNDIILTCEDNVLVENEITLHLTSPGLYQLYLKYEIPNKFSINNAEFTCQSRNIFIKYSDTIYFHRLKYSVLISKEKITKSNCNNSTKCPYSYYCEEYTGECKKCLGMFSQCSDRKTGISCSRFSNKWESVSPETVQKECKEEYYNLQYLDEMSYDINPPIISNAATISFWLFTTKDFNEPSNPDDSNPNIYHITLEDFFVVTIIPGKSQYIIYVTGYEMYHEAYGTI